MNVSCPDCQSVFRVDPAKVTGANLRARCAVCGGLIPVGASISWADDFPSSTPNVRVPFRAAPERATGVLESQARVAEAVPQPASTPPFSPASTPPFSPAFAPPFSPALTPHPRVEGVAPAAASNVAPAAAPIVAPAAAPIVAPAAASFVAPAAASIVAPTVPPRTADVVPSVERSTRPTVDALGAEALGAAGSAEQGVGATRVPPFSPARRPTPLTPAFGAPILPSSLRPPTPAFIPSPTVGAFGAPLATPPTPRDSTPVSQHSIAPGLDSRQGLSDDVPRATSPRPSPVAPFVPPTAGASGVTPPRRPGNPFLSNDPNQKARRLARALVSDMVAYHPQKREEGVRTGSLKQLFRDEIKKSYEEYVEQVGREFAESTAHFQDALNEVLAGGKRIF